MYFITISSLLIVAVSRKRIQRLFKGFPCGAVVGNLPPNSRGHGFNPWSRKIPHAAEQLSQCTTTTERVLQSPRATNTEPMCQLLKPTHLEPVLHNKRSHHNEKPMHRSEEQPPLAATREKPAHSNEDPIQLKTINT